MNNEYILNNAPEGATHVTDRITFLRKRVSNELGDCWQFWDDRWVDSQRIYRHYDIRSLSNIQEIVDLKNLLSKIRDDLLIRSEERDSGGRVVVNLSSSIWDRLNEVIDG